MNIEQTEIYNKREYKYTKEQYLRLKNEIKDLGAEQKTLKKDTKYDVIDRVFEQSRAQSKVAGNKFKIHILHMLYDEVRGKENALDKLNTYGLRHYYLKQHVNKVIKEYLEETKTLL